MTSELEKTPLVLDNASRFRNFDWEKAKNFYYVAKCGSFVNAARFLNISQSSLSRQIIYLEQHLGCPLFARHSGGIKLTRKGEELFSLVETTFIGFKDFAHSTHTKTHGQNKRRIRIATTHALASYVIGALIVEYSIAHPYLVFELISDDHLLDIVLNDVDIAIRPLDLKIKQINGVCYEDLFSVEKKLYASEAYLKKHGEPTSVEDLKNHYLLAFGPREMYPYGDVNWILTLGMPSGKLHEPIFTSNSIETLVEAAEKGIGIIGSYEKFSIIKKAQLKSILPNIKNTLLKEYFIHPNYLKNDKVIQEVKEYLYKKLNP